VNKWADLTYLAGARAETPADPWSDPDQAVLDQLRRTVGDTPVVGCGHPDCVTCPPR
jgi:hypothetical protein